MRTVCVNSNQRICGNIFLIFFVCVKKQIVLFFVPAQQGRILHRFVDGKDELIIGSPRMPEYITVAYDDMELELCWRLNESDCFDKPMSFVTNDVLVVSIDGFEKHFAFEFNGPDWKPARDKDAFELMRAYEEIKQGCVSTDGLTRRI